MLSSSSIRIDIYLPLYYNNNKKIEKSKFVDTFNELVEIFGGCSADQYSILGSWKDPNSDTLYNDENYLRRYRRKKNHFKEIQRKIKRKISTKRDNDVLYKCE